MGFTITSCVLSGVMIIINATAFSIASSGYPYYSSETGYFYNPYESETTMFAVFLVVSVVEFFISIESSIYCCDTVYTTNGAVVGLLNFQ